MKDLEKKEPNFERHDVENTPFSIVKETTTGKCKITIGMHLLSEKEFINIETAKGYLESKPWEIIMNATALMAEMVTKQLTNQNPQNND